MWWQRALLTKKYKQDCGYIAQDAARGTVGLPWAGAVVRVQWRVTDPGRRRDRDNALASIKAGLDSLSGVIVRDDSTLRPEFVEPFFVKVPPRQEGVWLEIAEVPG